MTEEELRILLQEERQEREKMDYIDYLRIRAEKAEGVYTKARLIMIADTLEFDNEITEADRAFVEL